MSPHARAPKGTGAASTDGGFPLKFPFKCATSYKYTAATINDIMSQGIYPSSSLIRSIRRLLPLICLFTVAHFFNSISMLVFLNKQRSILGKGGAADTDRQIKFLAAHVWACGSSRSIKICREHQCNIHGKWKGNRNPRRERSSDKENQYFYRVRHKGRVFKGD